MTQPSTTSSRAAAAGLGRRPLHRPPGGAARRPDRADAARARRVRRGRRASTSPASASCCSTGAEAQEAFFRAPDEQLDQAAAYPFMTPIFGEGVVFDATPEQRKEALRNQSLRDKFMRGHAEMIAARDRAHGRAAGATRARSTCSTSSPSSPSTPRARA